MRSARTALVLLTVGVLVVSMAACGGDETAPADGGTAGSSTPDTYALQMCGAASAWMTALQDRNTQLQEELGAADAGDIGAVKDLIVAFLSGAVEDTEGLIDDVSTLPRPDVQDGEQIHNSILSAFTQARDLFADARDQVADLDPSDATAFTQALSDLGTTLGEAGTEIAGSVQGLENAELESAFNDTPACNEVAA